MKLARHEQHWYVVYTRPRSESIVATSAVEMGIEAYLPLHKVARKWSDRIKTMQVPLFPNYVFVNVDNLRRHSLFSIKGLVRFVSAEHKPVVIRDTVINNIKSLLVVGADVQQEEYFQEGTEVTIKSGQFSGMVGSVTKGNGNARLVIRIDGLMKAFSISVPAGCVEAVHSTK